MEPQNAIVESPLTVIGCLDQHITTALNKANQHLMNGQYEEYEILMLAIDRMTEQRAKLLPPPGPVTINQFDPESLPAGISFAYSLLHAGF